MGWRLLCLWLSACLVLQAKFSEAHACSAEYYAEKGGLTGRQYFPDRDEYNEPRFKKVGFPNGNCTMLAGHFLDTGSEFVIITLLGGWTTKEGLWQTRLARHLADTLNLSVLAMDVTGRGESCGIEEVPGFSQGVNDLTAAVDYVNSMEGRYAAAILGHSFGAVQSFMYAARVANVPVMYVAEPGQIRGISEWRWDTFHEEGLVQDPAQPMSTKLVNWHLTREGFMEISTVDPREEAKSIPEKTHLYWLAAEYRLRFEIDDLNDTGAFNHIPGYQSIELMGEGHHFVSNVSYFFSLMEDTMRKELAQPDFLKEFIRNAGPAQQSNCLAREGSIHRRLSGANMPDRLLFGPHFPTEGAQGLVNPAAIYDPHRGWLTTVVHMASFTHLCPTQLCRTWQKVVVGYLGPTDSALPQPPMVKGAVALEFDPSSFSRTINNVHAAKHGGISFTSYRPFMFHGEPHVSFAMAAYDASLNLKRNSPNKYKRRTQITGIARVNMQSKQLVSVYEFQVPLVPRREQLCCDKNWGILELLPTVDMPPQLHIVYTLLPCLTVFTFNVSAFSGADFKSAHCLTDAHSDLVQQETALDMHDVRISGHPIVSQLDSDGQPSELMVLVHHSWRMHGGAAHWAATVDPRTWQVTQVSMKPVLTHESFHTYNEFVKNIIAVGSYHLEGKTLRILFGDGDKYASWQDVDTTTIQFLSLDRADSSRVVTVNDASLGDMLNGGTTQAQYQADKAWRRVK